MITNRIAKRRAERAEAEEQAQIEAFENNINLALKTGALDEALRVCNADGVAEVVPVLDSEPISALVDALEEVGGKANVFVHTDNGVVALAVKGFAEQAHLDNKANAEAEVAADDATANDPEDVTVVTEVADEVAAA